MSKIDKLIENGIKSLMIENLEEKAVSKNQQQFMGMVHAYKKGEMKDAPASVKKAAKGMTKKAAKDFASTKHKGLPTRVDESVIGDILIIADENNTYEKFTAELIKQKYIMPDELEDPETEKELRAMYDGVKDGSSINEDASDVMRWVQNLKHWYSKSLNAPDVRNTPGGQEMFKAEVKKWLTSTLNEALAPTNDLKSKMPDHVKGWAKWVAQHANGEWWYYDSIPRLVPGIGWKNNNRDGYQFGSDIKTAPQGWEKSSQELKESLNENKGQDAAIDLINKLRRTLYPKLSDLELEAFKNEMAQHLDATINESKMNTKTESIAKQLKEAIDPKYKTFYDQVYKHVNELDRILGANKPPKVPEEIWNRVYGLVGQMADKIDFLDTGLLKNLKENKRNTKTESIVKRLKEDTEYQKFFKSAMDKFGVKSPKELSDKKKKEFFNYVDKNYKAKSEALNEEFFAAHSSDSADTRKVITQLNNTFKSLQSQYNVPSRILDIAVNLVNQLVEQGYEDGRAEVEGML